MTTVTPTGKSAAELPQTEVKRWTGPLDREDPEIHDRVLAPRPIVGVAEATPQPRLERVLDIIARTIVSLNELLSGPPTSAQDRVKRDIAQHKNWPHYAPMGL
jgi:hypothetical protein